MRGLLAIVLGGFLFVHVVGTAAAQVNDPPVIVDAFERARSQGKVDIALAYFADDATIVLRDSGQGPLVGKTDIRRFLQRYAGTRTPPVVTSDRHVAGNRVTWTERQQGQTISPVEIAVEAVVQDGKIKLLSYSLATAPASAATPPSAPAMVPAAVALGGIMLLAVSLLAIAAALPRRSAPVSTLHGKLLASLGEWRAIARP